jgi:hypothetical protein
MAKAPRVERFALNRQIWPRRKATLVIPDPERDSGAFGERRNADYLWPDA